MSDPRARIPEQSCMDTLTRVLDERGEDMTRLVIVGIGKDGESSYLYSNASSEPELKGMLFTALYGHRNLAENES